MGLTVVRYRGSPVNPHAEVEVSSPLDAVTLLRAWQRAYPNDCGMLLDDQRQPIAVTQPAGNRNQ
jgi:hypothetical protein